MTDPRRPKKIVPGEGGKHLGGGTCPLCGESYSHQLAYHIRKECSSV